MKYLRVILIILTLSLVFLPDIVLAVDQGFLDTAEITECMKTGNCQLADVAEGFKSLIRLLLGGMGAVALLYFVIGGFQLLISSGNQEKVRKGQQTMINTVIALFVAFTSYVLLSFFINYIIPVNEEYQFGGGRDECALKEDGAACRVIAGSEAINPYECFQQECQTKCAINKERSGVNWQCTSVGSPEELTPDTTPYWEKNKCPGDEHNICILLNTAGQPALLDDPAYEAFRVFFEFKKF